jgi:uncharacterized protein YrzB (UPF0473 family)
MKELKTMNEDDNTIVLTDEDGNELECEYLDTVNYKDKDYAVLFPLDQDEEDGDVIILELAENEDGEEEYLTVEDEGLLDEVFDEYMRVLELEDDEEEEEDEEEEDE